MCGPLLAMAEVLLEECPWVFGAPVHPHGDATAEFCVVLRNAWAAFHSQRRLRWRRRRRGGFFISPCSLALHGHPAGAAGRGGSSSSAASPRSASPDGRRGGSQSGTERRPSDGGAGAQSVGSHGYTAVACSRRDDLMALGWPCCQPQRASPIVELAGCSLRGALGC